MKGRKGLLWGCMALSCMFGASVQAQVDLAPFIQDEGIRDLKISPDGRFLAATLPAGDRSAIAILNRIDRSVVASFQLPSDTHIADFWWAKDDRLLFGLAERLGSRDYPIATGEMYAMNADGGRAQLLVGYRVQNAGTGTNIRSGPKEERVFAWPIDMLPGDPRNVLVGISPFAGDPYTRVDRMDVYTGRRHTVATVPVTRAQFVTDHEGEVRFAVGAKSDNLSQLYYRAGRGADWELVNHQGTTGRVETPIGFSSDGSVAYLQVTQPIGPDAIVAMDIATRERQELLRDAVVDPEIIYRPGTEVAIGVRYPGARPRMAFFEPDADDARLFRMFEEAFPGDRIVVASSTRDARTKLLLTTSDQDPGSFFTYDSSTKKADFVVARRAAIDPQRMAEMAPVAIRARDGVMVHGYLTRPAGAPAGQALPLVVLPHGGPFGITDEWAFDPEVQILAQAGYAVLQVNYRGSGGYGRSFQLAGAREWGGKMQDDLTDATRWAIEQGHASADRICIYGGSYGAYAAMMGAAREPELYRCAAGYVGVYDLPMMRNDDRRGGAWLRTWFDEWVGNDAQALSAISPIKRATDIRVPVLLVAGGKDEVAPVAHTRSMERALQAANVPVETLYVANEGHGFYKPENRRAHYTKLLDFLATHLGGERAGG